MTTLEAGPGRRARPELPEWLLDLEPGTEAFDEALEGLSDDDRRALVDWLATLTPNATFEALGYEPTPRQWELHDLPAWSEGGPWDTLYGGAAGGGKTRGLLMDGIGWAARIPGIELWYVRATYPELRDSFLEELEKINHARLLGAEWTKGDYTLRMPNGAKLKFRHGGTEDAVGQLLSAQCQGLYIDERTTMAPKLLDRIIFRVRSSDPDIPIIGVRSGSNPGRVGHMDCKTKFVDPAPLGHRRIRVEMDGLRLDRYFIPARIEDNPHLDAGYEARLGMLDPAIQHAYRTGSWEYFEGMAFVDFDRNVHVVEPEAYPLTPGYPLGVGVDYGIANPFCALWGMKLPDGLIVVHRELYRTELAPAEQAGLVLASEQAWERPRERGSVRTWLDPACWARQPDSPKPIAGAPPKRSIAADYREAGVHVERAYNDRLGGKRLVHAGLRTRDAKGTPHPPHLLIHSTCVNLIRTLPNLPRDKANPEDVDTNAEDHCLAAGTLVSTPGGEVPIEDVGEGDTVLIRDGIGVVVRAGLTWRDAPVVTVTTASGAELTCTPDHLLFTGEGRWTTAEALTPCDTLWERTPSSSRQPPSSTPASGTTSVGATSNARASGCTDGSGPTTTGPSPLATTSTTTTRTARITQGRTWSSRSAARTSATTLAAHPLLSARHALATRGRRRQETPASRSISGQPRPGPAGRAWNWSRSRARSATPPSRRPSRRAPGSAVELARLRPVAVVSVRTAGRADVYDLTVLGRPEFIANGIVAHNCYDALRYLLGGLTGKAPRPARGSGEAQQAVRAGTGGVG